MRNPESADLSRRRRVWPAVLAAAVVLGLAAWLLARRSAQPPEPPESSTVSVPRPGAAGSSSSGNGPAPPTERPGTDPATAAPAPAPARRPPARVASARPAPAARPGPELRVTSDVPGALVFLDRKYLGVTPLVSRDVTPGAHQLNVQTEGRPPNVQTVEIAASAPTAVAVEVAAVRLDARVPVRHQHRVGSCEGTLHATPDALRYDTAHKDAFSVPLAQIETFAVEYADARLRVKQRGGPTWTFTTPAGSADPLVVFHREVDAVRVARP